MKPAINNAAQSDESPIEQVISDAVKRAEESFQTAREAVSDTLERGERLLRRSRNLAEDYAEEVTHRVRRNPMAALGLVFAAGAIAGGLFALMVPRHKPVSGNATKES